jgi:heptaprenyl diphosphate synthase/octaprenyl-diphosphate synthase
MVNIQAPRVDLFQELRPELDRVEQRIVSSATIDLPIVSTLVTDIVRNAGKRLRPVLLLLSARAFESNTETAIVASAGIELLHTASLVHDDNIDRADLRRGQPTLNSKLSSGAVILIGDYLFAQSAILAAATNSTRVVSIFATTLGEICDGQLREVMHARQLDQDREDYDKRIWGKTAALFAGAAEMGAVIGNAPEEAIQQLRAFGGDLGMAFQIIDDVLDLREGTDTLGKPAGNDLRQGIVTLPTMYYAEGLEEGGSGRDTLLAIVEGEITDDATIDDLVDDIRRSGALARAEHEAHVFADAARNRLDVVADQETRRLLEATLDLTLERIS